MRVSGEAFALINFGMDFLALLLSARLTRTRLHPARAALSAALGTGYAFAVLTVFPALRSVPGLLAAGLIMALIAFGHRGLRAFPFLLAAGLLMAGCAGFLKENGIPGPGAALVCAGAALGLGVVLNRAGARGGGTFSLRISLNGKTVTLPALRDSGNLLSDGLTGLPVIVAPEKALWPILPRGVRTSDLSTLPRGWRLVRIRTAAGSRTVMCFHPDGLWLRRGSKKWAVDAEVAAADFPDARALLPEALFQQKEEEIHAGL